MTATDPSAQAVLQPPRGLERRMERGSLHWRLTDSRRTTLARAALGLLCLLVFLVIISSGRTDLFLIPRSVRPLPPPLAGPFSAWGPNIHLGGLVATFVVMVACYITLLRLGGRLPARVIVGAIVVLHILLALAPLLLSTDVFSYEIYGKIGAIYHFNPYVVGPYAIFHDELYPYIGSQWVKEPTAYGPLFTLLSYALARLGIGGSAVAYKWIAASCSLAAVGLTQRAAERLGRDWQRAIIVLGLNPVLLIYAVGGAHNDLIMLVAMVGAILAFISSRERASGGLIVTAVAVKLTAGLVLPFLLAARVARRTAPRYALLTGVAGALLITLIVSFAVFGTGPLRVLSTLQQIQSNGGRQSIPGAICWGLGFGTPSRGIGVGLDVALVSAVVWLLVAVRRERMDWLTASGWAMVALVVTGTFLLPWYIIWVLPFAALSRSRNLTIAAVCLTAIAMTSL